MTLRRGRHLGRHGHCLGDGAIKCLSLAYSTAETLRERQREWQRAGSSPPCTKRNGSEHGKLRARDGKMVLNPDRTPTRCRANTNNAAPPYNRKPQCLGSGYELLSRHTRRSIVEVPFCRGLQAFCSPRPLDRRLKGPEPRGTSQRLHPLNRAALPSLSPYPCAWKLVVCGVDADGVPSNDGTKNPAAYPERARARDLPAPESGSRMKPEWGNAWRR